MIPQPEPFDGSASQTAVQSVIRSRRSIKPADFSQKRVSDEIVWQMLNSANWAPTHGMTEPWRFFIYSGESRNALGKRLAEIYREITSPEYFKLPNAEKLKANAVQKYATKQARRFRDSPGNQVIWSAKTTAETEFCQLMIQSKSVTPAGRSLRKLV